MRTVKTKRRIGWQLLTHDNNGGGNITAKRVIWFQKTTALRASEWGSRRLSDTILAPVLLFRIFRSRRLLDTRLAPVLLFCSFRSRRHSDPRLAPSIYYLYVWSHWLTYSCASCLHLLYLMSELSCEYFHSTHLACWFGQMLTKAISWMKSLIARPMPRGVPVSPARSRILVTCIVYASATRNKSSRASLQHSKSCSILESCHSLRDDISTTVIIVS